MRTVFIQTYKRGRNFSALWTTKRPELHEDLREPGRADVFALYTARIIRNALGIGTFEVRLYLNRNMPARTKFFLLVRDDAGLELWSLEKETIYLCDEMLRDLFRGKGPQKLFAVKKWLY